MCLEAEQYVMVQEHVTLLGISTRDMSVLKKEIAKTCSCVFLNKYYVSESTAVVLAQTVEFLQSYETKRSLRCSQRPALGP
jgi:hypothetical protein